MGLTVALGYILLENLALTAVLSGGDWSLPLTNLQDPLIVSNPTRCTDPTDLEASQFTMTWPSPVYCTEIMLCGHSMGLDDLFRVTVYSGEEQLHQTEWTEVYGRQFKTAALPWEQGNWFTGKPRLEDIDGYGRHRLIRLPQSFSTDRILVELDARGNEDDLDVGYLMVARPLAPAWNYDWGRRVGYKSRSQRDLTAGGREIVGRRTAARDHTVTFPNLSKEEAFAIYDRGIRDDIHPVVFNPDADDALHAFRELFPARMTITDPPRQTDELGEWSVSLYFEELQG